LGGHDLGRQVALFVVVVQIQQFVTFPRQFLSDMTKAPTPIQRPEANYKEHLIQISKASICYTVNGS
jgi:hypothetical protein